MTIIHLPIRVEDNSPMENRNLSYSHDIEARVARQVCGGTCTQAELGRLWNVNRERIRQIEEAALTKLRKRALWCRETRETLAALDSMRKETHVEIGERFAPPIFFGDHLYARHQVRKPRVAQGKK